MKMLLAALLLATCLPLSAWAQASDADVRRVSQELRCMVCEGQSLADSQATAAVAMREEIRRELAAGSSDEQILDLFVARYGPSVRWKPPVSSTTGLLWFGPLLMLTLGGFVVWRRLGQS